MHNFQPGQKVTDSMSPLFTEAPNGKVGFLFSDFIQSVRPRDV